MDTTIEKVGGFSVFKRDQNVLVINWNFMVTLPYWQNYFFDTKISSRTAIMNKIAKYIIL